MGESRAIAVTVNGKRYEEEVEVRVTLADFIRHQLGLTGTHLGCEHGVCGACTILLDGRSARSCLMLAVQADGHEILTVEGIAPGPDQLHPLQQAFHDNHGLQCGFCTPGMLTTLLEFLRDNPDPSEKGSPHRHIGQSVPLYRVPKHRDLGPRCRQAPAGACRERGVAGRRIADEKIGGHHFASFQASGNATVLRPDQRIQDSNHLRLKPGSADAASKM